MREKLGNAKNIVQKGQLKYAGFSDWFVERQKTPLTRKTLSHICFQKTKSEGLNIPSDLFVRHWASFA